MADQKDEGKDKALLTWRARSRPYNPDQEKSRSVLVVLGVLIGVVLILAGEWMLIILMAAGVFYYYASNRTPPEEVEYSITDKGIKAYGRVYLWWEFRSWWIEPRTSEYLLGFDLASGMMGRMYIPMGSVKQSDAEKILTKYLENKKPEETAVDKMTKWVGEKFPLQDKI